jgi:hypothetical protein
VTTSRLHDAILAVVAALNAAPSVTSLATVYDGPVVIGDRPTSAVFVGYDGQPEGDYAATDGWSQTWAGLGALRRDEEFDIQCCVVSWSGDAEDVPGRRAAAVAVLDAVGAVLRAAATIGLGLPQPTWAEFAGGELFQEQGPTGLQARIPFTIHVRTRV